jgi:hypothetical protein
MEVSMTKEKRTPGSAENMLVWLKDERAEIIRALIDDGDFPHDPRLKQLGTFQLAIQAVEAYLAGS